MKPNNVTRAEARRRAAAHVLHRLFKRAKVVDGAEVSLGIYCSNRWRPANVWIVYQNPEDSLGLQSSAIVVVSKRTGQVLYAGPAGNEG